MTGNSRISDAEHRHEHEQLEPGGGDADRVSPLPLVGDAVAADRQADDRDQAQDHRRGHHTEDHAEHGVDVEQQCPQHQRLRLGLVQELPLVHGLHCGRRVTPVAPRARRPGRSGGSGSRAPRTGGRRRCWRRRRRAARWRSRGPPDGPVRPARGPGRAPCPADPGSTPITKISPCSCSSAVAGCTLVQQKPARPSASRARRNPAGSNQGSSMRRPRVSSIQPPCSGWLANARLLTSSQAASSCPGTKVRTVIPSGQRGSSRRGSTTRCWRSSRSRWNPAAVAAASIASSGSSSHSTAVPPPCAPTCSVGPLRAAPARPHPSRASGATTTPTAQ